MYSLFKYKIDQVKIQSINCYNSVPDMYAKNLCWPVPLFFSKINCNYQAVLYFLFFFNGKRIS